jgi:hypothetical protein
VLPLDATAPIPLLIAADAALAEVHVKVAVAPDIIDAGEAANVTVVTVCVGTRPTQPINVPVTKVTTTDNNDR